MHLRWFLLLAVVTLTGFSYDLVNADGIDQVGSLHGDKAQRSFKDSKEISKEFTGGDDEERRVNFDFGKLKTLFQKFPVLNKNKTQMGKTSDLNKLKAFAQKDPEIMKLKSSVGKAQLTNRDVKKLRAFAAKNHLEGLDSSEKSLILILVVAVVGIIASVIGFIPVAIRANQARQG